MWRDAFQFCSKTRFADNTCVNDVEEIAYLGSLITKTHNTRKLIASKIAVCCFIWKSMDIFWKHSTCPTRFKIQVYDAVVRAKLVYGLETIQLPKFLVSKLHTFQLKGLRKILKLKTTFVDRTNTNTKVFDMANLHQNPNNVAGKSIKPFSEYIQKKSKSLLGHIVRADAADPMRICTLEPDSNIPTYNQRRRVGRPRDQWAVNTYKHIWLQHHPFQEDLFACEPEHCMNQIASIAVNRGF